MKRLSNSDEYMKTGLTLNQLFFAASAALLVLSGCATSEPLETVDRNAKASEVVSQEFPRIGKLPPQDLSPGECGLFLFSGRPSPRFVFFGEAAAAKGKMIIDGEETIFLRTEASGEVFELHFSNQKYISPALGLEVFLEVVPEDEEVSQDGRRISSGTLRMKGANGWSMVMPVGGAASCSRE